MLTFDLVKALNNVGTNGKAIFGAFSAGTYNQNNPAGFIVFNLYAYTNNTVATPPYSNQFELAWFTDGTSRPHIGIENINGNININQNLWNESIYWHPGGSGNWNDSTNRPCVVRFTTPNTGVISANGRFFKGESPIEECGGVSNTSFMIKHNGVDKIARDPNGIPSSTEILIDLQNISVVAGDTIDFILDNGLYPICRDSALTLNVSVQLDKTQTPIPIISGNLPCNATSISGTIHLTQSGTVSLRTIGGATVLGLGTITPIPNTVNGQWTISGLNLSNYGGNELELVAIDPPSTLSDPTTFTVDNTGCAPVVTADAVNDTVSTFANTAVVILLNTNDVVCN